MPRMTMLGMVLLGAATTAAARESNTVTVTPRDTGVALVNPGMGWTLHYYSNIPRNYGWKLAPSDTVDDFPGLSVVYLRIPWSYIEQEEGVFTWNVLDTPAQRWIEKGKQVAFRITCSESWMEWATPKWVHDAGAKGLRFKPGPGVRKDGPFWEPDYGDPVFLEKLDHFLEAMARRYDGNPNVAFVDIGTYGVWGEAHTWSSTRVDYPLEVKKAHIDLHVKHFKHTQLALSDDAAGPQAPGAHHAITDYALSRGVTLRDDSICVQPPPNSWYHDAMARLFAPHFPVILEHEHYGSSKSKGTWGDGSLLLKAVEDYRASYLSIHWWPRIELEENRDIIDRINRRMGYRLQLRKATWPKRVALGESFEITSEWTNAGVAPCYPGGFVAYTLKDGDGGIVAVLVDESHDVRVLENGPPDGAPALPFPSTFTIGREVGGAIQTVRFAPNTRPGRYNVYVSVGRRDGTPVIALPLAGEDGHRRYRLGEMEITGRPGQFEVAVASLAVRDKTVVAHLVWTIHEPLPENTEPFGHVEVDGKLVGFGRVEGATEEAWRTPGTVSSQMLFPIPGDLRGATATLAAGLWVPGDKSLPLERLRPTDASGDRRVTLGTLTVDRAEKAAVQRAR